MFENRLEVKRDAMMKASPGELEAPLATLM
jgi:hypothetical protein